MTSQHRKLVRVPAELVERGLRWGEAIVAHYASGGSPSSRAVSGDRGTEKDPQRQARGKIGEAAFATWMQLDAMTCVKWDLFPDKGSDIRTPCGFLADVKTTFPPYRLIWSRDVNHLFHQKTFDILVAVSIDETEYSMCWIEGWILKDEFFALKKISDGHGLEKGTWWVEKDILHDADDLCRLRVPVTPWMRARAHRAVAERKQRHFITGQWP